MTTKRVRLISSKTLLGLALMLPMLVLLFSLRLYPIVSAFVHSFFRWDGFETGRFLGLANYERLIRDPNMIRAAANIGKFVLTRLVLNLTFPMLGALLIYHLRAQRTGYVYRVLFMVPMVVPLIVVLLTWKFIYHPYDGVLNRVLEVIGLEQLQRIWLGDFDTALWAVIGIGAPWVTGLGISGFALLIYLAGLQQISTDVMDALTVDGVRMPTRIFRIEIPLIADQIKVIAVLTTINTLQSYVPVMIMTGGGPSNASLVPGLYLYQTAFHHDRFGYAASIGVVMAIVLVAVTMLTNRFVRTRQ